MINDGFVLIEISGYDDRVKMVQVTLKVEKAMAEYARDLADALKLFEPYARQVQLTRIRPR